AANTVWWPIIDSTLKSLDEDSEQLVFLCKEYEALESDLWNQKIFIAIMFLNYTVQESIYENTGSNMGIHRIWEIIDKLVYLIPENNDYDDNTLYPSNCHYMILKQIEVMVNWLNLARSQKVDFRVEKTIVCL